MRSERGERSSQFSITSFRRARLKRQKKKPFTSRKITSYFFSLLFVRNSPYYKNKYWTEARSLVHYTSSAGRSIKFSSGPFFLFSHFEYKTVPFRAGVFTPFVVVSCRNLLTGQSGAEIARERAVAANMWEIKKKKNKSLLDTNR